MCKRGGARKRRGEKGRNAFDKNRAIRITPTVNTFTNQKLARAFMHNWLHAEIYYVSLRARISQSQFWGLQRPQIWQYKKGSLCRRPFPLFPVSLSRTPATQAAAQGAGGIFQVKRINW